jgi:hypothetical protein
MARRLVAGGRTPLRWDLLFAITATTVLAIFFVLELRQMISEYEAVPGSFGRDFTMYIDRVNSWLAGQGFYLDRQLHGPYHWQVGDALYPPSVILLVAPFLVLPAVLFWAIPIATVLWVVFHHRPKAWAWPLIVFCAVWPFTVNSIGAGNPVMWVSMFVALGTVYGWPSVFVFLKPSLAPFAFIGANHRSWWVAAALFALASLVFLPLWIQYVAVIRDSGLTWDYSAHDICICLIGVMAWIGRTKPGDRPAEVAPAPHMFARLGPSWRRPARLRPAWRRPTWRRPDERPDAAGDAGLGV